MAQALTFGGANHWRPGVAQQQRPWRSSRISVSCSPRRLHH